MQMLWWKHRAYMGLKSRTSTSDMISQVMMAFHKMLHPQLYIVLLQRHSFKDNEVYSTWLSDFCSGFSLLFTFACGCIIDMLYSSSEIMDIVEAYSCYLWFEFYMMYQS
ncbi:hypothetical protein Dimus_001075 [Dionaea muscipula]